MQKPTKSAASDGKRGENVGASWGGAVLGVPGNSGRGLIVGDRLIALSGKRQVTLATNKQTSD